MNDVKWIKVDVNLFSDRKIMQVRSLPEGSNMFVLWIGLMCLAGQINDNGKIYMTKELPYTDEMLAHQFNLPVSVVRMGLKVFEQFGMIEKTDTFLQLSSWGKWQDTDRLQKLRDYQRGYHQKYRAEQKALNAPREEGGCVSCLRKVYVNEQNRIEENREEENRIDSTEVPSEQKTRKRFVRPTLEEVQAYIKEKGYDIDPEEWFAYYDSVGWMIGKKHMVSWKSAIVTWSKKPREQKAERQRPGSYFVPTKQSMTYDEFMAQAVDYDEDDEDDEPLTIGKGAR